MRRFLIFPPLFAVWFLLARVALWSVNSLGASLALRLAPPQTDIYYHAFPISYLLRLFLPALEIGAIAGCVFAALDFTLHRDRRSDEPIIPLLWHLAISGVVAVGLLLSSQGVMLVVAIQANHRRYHAYAPELIWFNWISCAQVLVLIASVLWAMGKMLKRP